MIKYIIDTNTISEPLKKQPNEAVIDMLRTHENEIAISTLTLHEMYYAMMRLTSSKRKDIIKFYIEEVVHAKLPIISYDDNIAELHATERATLEQKGLTTPFIDGQIAATALANNLILVTRNLKDFKHFNNLKVISWHNEQ